LNIGRPVIAGWGWFFLAWFAAAAAAAVLWPGWRGVAFGAVPAVLALALRLMAAPWSRRGLRELLPEARWSWRDGPGRCRRELRLAGHGVAAAALTGELESAIAELASLASVQPPPAPLPALPRFRGVRVVGGLGWTLVIACVGAAGARAYLHPPSAKELKAAWAPAVDPAKSAKPAPNLGKKSADEKDSAIKVSWPFKPEDNPVKLGVRSADAGTSEQIAYATKHGRELVAPYRPDSITTLIVMPVPGGDDAAVMLFDGKRGELANQQVYHLEFRPIPRTWVEVGGRQGVYLDR
jgi:hypothetical protein